MASDAERVVGSHGVHATLCETNPAQPDGGCIQMTGILTPSECAALAAKVSTARLPLPPLLASGLKALLIDGGLITEVANAAPRMLATIADLREQADETASACESLAVQLDDMKAWKDRESATIIAHEVTIAKLMKRLEERE